MRKYRNKPTVIDGVRFASKAEARRYMQLKMLQRAGVIERLTLQPRFEIWPAYTNGAGKRIRPTNYTADFEYWENGKHIVEDVKSSASKTQAYNLRKKLFEKIYHPLTITEVEV